MGWGEGGKQCRSHLMLPLAFHPLPVPCPCSFATLLARWCSAQIYVLKMIFYSLALWRHPSVPRLLQPSAWETPAQTWLLKPRCCSSCFLPLSKSLLLSWVTLAWCSPCSAFSNRHLLREDAFIEQQYHLHRDTSASGTAADCLPPLPLTSSAPAPHRWDAFAIAKWGFILHQLARKCLHCHEPAAGEQPLNTAFVQLKEKCLSWRERKLAKPESPWRKQNYAARAQACWSVALLRWVHFPLVVGLNVLSSPKSNGAVGCSQRWMIWKLPVSTAHRWNSLPRDLVSPHHWRYSELSVTSVLCRCWKPSFPLGGAHVPMEMPP